MVKEAEAEILSQDAYVPSAYADASWEIVGSASDVDDFAPMSVPVLAGHGQTSDPMFADYGGASPPETTSRWHLPGELAYQTLAQQQEEVEAEPSITVTEAELEVFRGQVFEEGRLSGIEEAVVKNAENLARAQERITAVVADLKTQVSERLLAIEREAVKFALAVAEKIIGGAVEINPEYIVKIVTEALALSGTATIRAVRVSPEDLEFIQLFGIGKNLKEQDAIWDFVADPSVRSGCIVETSAGEIDYQLDQAWERVKDQVIRIIK